MVNWPPGNDRPTTSLRPASSIVLRSPPVNQPFVFLLRPRTRRRHRETRASATAADRRSPLYGAHVYRSPLGVDGHHRQTIRSVGKRDVGFHLAARSEGARDDRAVRSHPAGVPDPLAGGRAHRRRRVATRRRSLHRVRLPGGLEPLERCPVCGGPCAAARFGPLATVFAATVLRVPVPGARSAVRPGLRRCRRRPAACSSTSTAPTWRWRPARVVRLAGATDDGDPLVTEVAT